MANEPSPPLLQHVSATSSPLRRLSQAGSAGRGLLILMVIGSAPARCGRRQAADAGAKGSRAQETEPAHRESAQVGQSAMSKSATSCPSSYAMPNWACNRPARNSTSCGPNALAAEARLRQLEQERALREKELDAERGALAGELRAAYVNGREEQLKLLLNQEDPATFRAHADVLRLFRPGARRPDRATFTTNWSTWHSCAKRSPRRRLACSRSKTSTPSRSLRSSPRRTARAKAVSAIDRQIKKQGSELCAAAAHRLRRSKN